MVDVFPSPFSSCLTFLTCLSHLSCLTHLTNHFPWNNLLRRSESGDQLWSTCFPLLSLHWRIRRTDSRRPDVTHLTCHTNLTCLTCLSQLSCLTYLSHLTYHFLLNNLLRRPESDDQQWSKCFSCLTLACFSYHFPLNNFLQKSESGDQQSLKYFPLLSLRWRIRRTGSRHPDVTREPPSDLHASEESISQFRFRYPRIRRTCI